MGREQERIRRKLENNPAAECNKVRQKYCPYLFQDFAETKDPRHLSYTEYSNDELLGTMFYKGIAGIESMQSMTYEFNKEKVVKNLLRFMGGKEKEYLPHAVTINEYFERLDPEELQKVQQKQVYRLIRSKAFYDARFMNKWLVVVDGTQTYSGSRKLNEGCLERHHNKGTDKEKVNYHCDVLEAKIVLGESLAEKLKKVFPRLPIILLADSLYASEPVMEICRGNNWDYIIRDKTGSIPSITEEYENISEKGRSEHAEYVNDIDYNGNPVNMLRYWEERIKKG